MLSRVGEEGEGRYTGKERGWGRNSGIWWGRGVGKVHTVGLGGRRGSEGIGGNKEVGEGKGKV